MKRTSILRADGDTTLPERTRSRCRPAPVSCPLTSGVATPVSSAVSRRKWAAPRAVVGLHVPSRRRASQHVCRFRRAMCNSSRGDPAPLNPV